MDTLPQQMKAYLAEDLKLVMKDLPVPTPTGNQVLIKVVAAGVNRPDVTQRQGNYPPPPGHSPIIGLEVSGIIVAKGEAASKFKLQDAVCALVNGGGYAEYVAVYETQCLPIPSGLDMVAAACIPETFFTVWHNFFQQSNIFQRKLQAGDTILIHGGSSGIGTTAIQLVRHVLGATTIVTVGSEEKRQKCLDLGANHAINYKTEDFVEAVQKITDGKGVDFVLDMVAGDYIQKDITIMKFDGRICIIGALGDPVGTIDFRQLMRKRLTISGSTLRAQTPEVKQRIANELQETVWPVFGCKIAPVMDKIFPFAQASEAHARMESSVGIGKIALVLQEDLLPK